MKDYKELKIGDLLTRHSRIYLRARYLYLYNKHLTVKNYFDPDDVPLSGAFNWTATAEGYNIWFAVDEQNYKPYYAFEKKQLEKSIDNYSLI